MAKKQACKCPNCDGPAWRMEHKGKIVVACEQERKVYELTPTGHKLADGGGWLSEIETRLAKLEAHGKPGEAERDDDDSGIEILFEDEE